MKYSVLILSYNSDINKLLLTIKSAILQDFEDYEIVISDDGSKITHFEEVKKYLSDKSFSNYKLIANKTNQGTVKNILSGLSQCSGKYIKFISAGDTLYNKDSIQNIYNFMESNHSTCCFGLIRGYCINSNNGFEHVPYYHPFDLKAYRLKDVNRIIKNLVLYSDNVCGASMTYEREFAIEYMNKISSHVVYEEDIFQVLAAVEGKPLHMYDDYAIWYEIGTGITTDKQSTFKKLIAQDVDRFYAHLYELYPNNKFIKKRYQLLGLYKINNLYIRTFFRFFVNPDALRYFIDSMKQRKAGVHNGINPTPGFMDDPDFLTLQ